jgi:hypothetical protein
MWILSKIEFIKYCFIADLFPSLCLEIYVEVTNTILMEKCVTNWKFISATKKTFCEEFLHVFIKKMWISKLLGSV